MAKPILIRPNGPHAVVGILLNKYYSTESERKSLVESLLGERNPNPEFLEAIAKLLKESRGRAALKTDIDRAYHKFSLYAPPRDCLLVFSKLPEGERTGRLTLLKSVTALGRALVDDLQYRQLFMGRILFAAERRLLLQTLGQQVLLDHLLRTAKERPALRLVAG